MRLQSYFKHFTCENKSRKNRKINIKNVNDYSLLLQYKFTIKELKQIIKDFNLPRCNSTKKDDIFLFVINCLYLYNKVYKIQKIWKKYFIKQFNKTLGPAYFKRELSNNIEDFLTTESIKDIHYYDFFSYKDKDGFIYSFNIVSLYNLIIKQIIKNPYNRIEFDVELVQNVVKRYKMNKILKKGQSFNISTPQVQVNLQQKIINLFQKMDELGKYTEVQWFNQLQKHNLCKFLYELYEIWFYRAQLSREIQISICPPTGNPFFNINPNYINYLERTQPLRTIQNIACSIMEKLLYSANNDANQNLGALYILSALTLVSTSARNSLPWLYTSVQY